jgi:hypothetical protein
LEKGNLKRSHSGAKRSDRLATFFGGPFPGRKEPNKRAPKVSVVELKETKIEVKDLGWVFESFKIIQKGFQ